MILRGHVKEVMNFMMEVAVKYLSTNTFAIMQLIGTMQN